MSTRFKCRPVPLAHLRRPDRVVNLRADSVNCLRVHGVGGSRGPADLVGRVGIRQPGLDRVAERFMEDRALAGDGVRRGPAPVQPDSQHIERRDYGRDDDARLPRRAAQLVSPKSPSFLNAHPRWPHGGAELTIITWMLAGELSSLTA